MANADKHTAPTEFLVEYYHLGEKHRETLTGTEDEIKGSFLAEGKVILKIAKASGFLGLSQTRAVDSNEVFAVIDTLGDLLSSNIPLSKAIDTVISSFYSKRASGMKKILSNMARTVKQGKELATAMALYPAVFGSITIGMVTAGEKSGQLTESLKTAAHYLQVNAKIRKEMIKNLTYPVALLVFGLVALLLNANVIIPKIVNSELFSSMPNAKENIFIKILNSLSYIVPSFLAVVLGAGTALLTLYKLRQEKAEALLFQIPVVREFFLYRNLYLSFHSMSKLIEVGVKIDKALEIVKESSKVLAIKQDLARAQEALRDGKDFAKGFTNLSDIEKAMLSVASNAEKLKLNLETISQRFYNVYLEKTESLAPKIYGVVLVLMGGVFVLIFLGIAIPYSQILKGIR